MISVCRICVLSLLLCMGIIRIAQAQTEDVRATKSELIFNLALLSQAPNRPQQDTYVICAFEEDITHLKATTLESQKLQNLQIFLVTVKSPTDVKRCNLLFIQGYVVQKPLELQQIIQKDSVLTVVHQSNKFSEYSHVEISEQDRHYQFALHLTAAKLAGLVFDTRLIKLATNIIN
jgi:hypothetical protein